ncbi:MAG: hypothetical protein WBH90_04550 [Aggregatilineales bacterium]|nr:DUF1573 domain-containing protein [Chloroflexota bacterium]HPV05579.1 hypothetical protein [Aggregatilineales bacterium]
MSHSRKRVQARRAQQAAQRKRLMAVAVAALGMVIVGVAALLLARSGSPTGYEPEYTGGPRVSLKQDFYNYGYVKHGTLITTDVEIGNVGDEPLQILDVPVVEVRDGC